MSPADGIGRGSTSLRDFSKGGVLFLWRFRTHRESHAFVTGPGHVGIRDDEVYMEMIHCCPICHRITKADAKSAALNVVLLDCPVNEHTDFKPLIVSELVDEANMPFRDAHKVDSGKFVRPAIWDEHPVLSGPNRVEDFTGDPIFRTERADASFFDVFHHDALILLAGIFHVDVGG